MKHSLIFTFLAICSTAFAQQMPPKAMANVANAPQAPQPLVGDPAAPVPAVAYRSVFKETTLGVEKETDNWRKANDEVGKFLRGHVDILKWEEQEAAKAAKSGMDKPAMPVKPEAAKPAPSATATPALAAPSTASPATKPSPASAHKH